MNSEITNVAKLVPVTVLRNKQNEPNVTSSIGNTETEKQNAIKSEESLKSQNAASKADRKETSLELVKSAAAQGNSILQATNRNLEFQVDDSTKKVVVKIVDSKSGDVVRQIPSEDMLVFIKRMQDLEGQQGAMLQDRA
ncbi:MAG: flagellar protein FlaG [Methylococcaceae bacterium]|nr:flagellar protein FlaG [Methylococcaceae bacterium]MDZ4158086.1 flagellar protein FlaG [Methylococcales bacterium]MDP2392877.1 flagellar protein FlaG [Methylococcaceae bacterium]MDP3020405.1 flagellar protein FlaG [Methylococcaceae bacterium]MDP3392012.1 flagellar protein FlaG [Methylococcaceae bacterium]